MLKRAPLPTDLKTCFKRQSAKPVGGDSNALVRVITDLRGREVKYIKCGNRLIRLYEAS